MVTPSHSSIQPHHKEQKKKKEAGRNATPKPQAVYLNRGDLP
jgi:hypothetical protein